MHLWLWCLCTPDLQLSNCIAAQSLALISFFGKLWHKRYDRASQGSSTMPKLQYPLWMSVFFEYLNIHKCPWTIACKSPKCCAYVWLQHLCFSRCFGVSGSSVQEISKMVAPEYVSHLPPNIYYSICTLNTQLLFSLVCVHSWVVLAVFRAQTCGRLAHLRSRASFTALLETSTNGALLLTPAGCNRDAVMILYG